MSIYLCMNVFIILNVEPLKVGLHVYLRIFRLEKTSFFRYLHVLPQMYLSPFASFSSVLASRAQKCLQIGAANRPIARRKRIVRVPRSKVEELRDIFN